MRPRIGLAAGTFSTNGVLHTPRYFHTTTVLQNGKVLVSGGDNNISGPLNGAELYDPATGTWAVTGSLSVPREHHTATFLPNGKVLVAGGGGFAELYDETTGTFSKVAGTLGAARFFASATLLPGGKTLITGGYSDTASGLPATPSAWLYQP